MAKMNWNRARPVNAEPTFRPQQQYKTTSAAYGPLAAAMNTEALERINTDMSEDVSMRTAALRELMRRRK